MQLPLDLAEEMRLAWDESERRATLGGYSEKVQVRPVGAFLFAQVPIVQEHPEKVCEVLDMKEGRGPADVPRTKDKAWNALDPFQQAALMDGFGSSFSARFYLDQQNLSDETGEIGGFLKKILERL